MLRFSLLRHILFLLVFCVFICGLWLLPAFLAGYPASISALLLPRNFAETGLFSFADGLGRFLSSSSLQNLGVPSAADGRLSAVFLAIFSHWIPWSNLLGWTALGAGILAAALIPWWLFVYKAFDARTAWVSTIVTSLLPIYWQQALLLSNYNFAFLFLFGSFASFVWIAPVSERWALAVSGLLFGLSVASKDVFLIFIPWMAIAYLWMHKAVLGRAAIGVVIFSACVGGVYLLPYGGDILTLGYPVNQNIARVWPGAENIANETYLHVYPDPYTYHFDRERFDAEYREWLSSQSTVKKLQLEKILLNYDLIEPSFLRSMGNGAWLFLNSIPSFFQQHTVGGVFIWLFILPGILALARRRPKVLWLTGGLILTSYFIVRFVLHYNREHLMNIAWILALFSAVGIVHISESLSTAQKRFSAARIIVLITAVLSVQLVQVNRTEMARIYRGSRTPEILHVADTLGHTSVDGVFAMPFHPSDGLVITVLSGKTTVLFHQDTVERLLHEGKLQEAFETYGITHVTGYPPPLNDEIKGALPDISVVEIIPVQALGTSSVTPFISYLLHLIR